jgi:hypothetical protein
MCIYIRFHLLVFRSTCSCPVSFSSLIHLCVTPLVPHIGTRCSTSLCSLVLELSLLAAHAASLVFLRSSSFSFFFLSPSSFVFPHFHLMCLLCNLTHSSLHHSSRTSHRYTLFHYSLLTCLGAFSPCCSRCFTGVSQVHVVPLLFAHLSRSFLSLPLTLLHWCFSGYEPRIILDTPKK